MTKKDIDKAAVDSCVFENSIFNPQLTPYYEQGFKDGANWRINSVWHDAKEDPKEKEMLVVIDKYGDIIQSEFMIYEFLGREKWSDYVIDVGIVRWCYRKDLLPNKEDNI